MCVFASFESPELRVFGGPRRPETVSSFSIIIPALAESIELRKLSK